MEVLAVMAVQSPPTRELIGDAISAGTPPIIIIDRSRFRGTPMLSACVRPVPGHRHFAAPSASANGALAPNWLDT